MTEYVVVLKQEGQPDAREIVYVPDTAFNMRDRWRGRGAGREALVLLDGVEVQPEYV